MGTLITRLAVFAALTIIILIWRELRHIHRRLDAWAQSVQILAETESSE